MRPSVPELTKSRRPSIPNLHFLNVLRRPSIPKLKRCRNLINLGALACPKQLDLGALAFLIEVCNIK